MNDIWVPIAIAMIGNAVAIVVVILSNTSAARREQRRLDREDERLELTRRDERVRRAREDRWRVVEFQKDYYVAFYQELRQSSLAIHNAGYELGPALEFGWNLPAYEALLRLRVFATAATYECADTAYSALWTWGDSGNGGYESPQEILFSDALASYLVAVRHDLGIEMDDNRLSEEDVLR